MIQVSVYSLEELPRLRENPWVTTYTTAPWLRSHMKDQIQTLELELGFLKMFLWCLPIKSAVRNFFVKATTVKSKEGLYDTCVWALCILEFKHWNKLTSKLLEKIERVKPRIRKYCLDLVDGSSRCKLYNRFRLLEFLDIMLNNLSNLVRLRSDKLLAVEMQIKTLQEKLKLFRGLVDFTTKRCTSPGELKKLSMYIQAWAYKAASLLYLYLVDGMQEEMASRLNSILFVLLQMMKPCTPEVKGMYLQVLKASKSSDSDNLLMGEIVANVADFLLEFPVAPITDSITTLRDGLIILTTFLMNPPQSAKQRKLMRIWKQTDAIMKEAVFVISSLNAQQTNEETCKENNNFYEFLKKIDKVKATIKKFYVDISESSRSNFPRTNVLGFIDFLLDNLGNLEEKLRKNSNLIAFSKHQIIAIQGELRSLRPFLNDIFATKVGEPDLWMKIINVAYQADHVVDSCRMIGFPIWHTMISLSHLIVQIKLIKNKVQIIRDKHSQKTRLSGVKLYLSQSLHAQASISRIDEVVVGFEEEAKTIIDKLTRGSEQLKVVSIVGMPGIGKTTLAKKVYNDAIVQSYFHKCSWIVVSQSYERRGLLLAILNDLVSEYVSNMKEDELAEKLYKSLKEQRYFIVMDDMWDSRAWKDLEESFPNDGNGSRIMFTSRIHNMALLPNPGYYTYPLRLLSFEGSSKLLQEKLKLKDGIPSDFSQVAEQVVEMCKGLPLSIVVVAGLLQRESRNLGWWKHVAERLHSKLADEGGCMDILQLSYNHLPDFLKPCFLYFGAFREDQVIEVKKLMQLWIAEGFIQKNGMRNCEDVAMGYLMDLIDRSLVIVSKRTATGKVRACRIHDLLHELCSVKASEESFWYSFHVSDNVLNSINYDQHRLCIHGKMWSSLELNFTGSPSVRTLIISSSTFTAARIVSLFDFLRVLNLENIHFSWDLLSGIVLLIHLRYLGVSCSICDVPSSIANLENLETFRVRVSGSNSRINFPESIWTMKNLRHVDMGKGAAVIDLSDDELKETSRLDYLDSFSWLAFHDNEDAEKVLRKLPRVKKLSLRSSKWGCYQGCVQVPVLDFLSNLESLKLCFDLKIFHTCQFSFPSTLKKLTLSKFCRPWSEISVIGMLPHLEVLKLLSDAFVGQTWDVEDELFLNLKYLKLKSLDIVEWNASIDSFPCLEGLFVEDCFGLEEIPSMFGEISTLKFIKVHSCFRAESSASQILKEQQDMGNEGFDVLIKSSLQLLFERFVEDRKNRLPPFFHRQPKLSLLWNPWKKHVVRKVSHRDICASPAVYDCVKRSDFTNVEGKRRVKKIKWKYNCQSRQAILHRHLRPGLK